MKKMFDIFYIQFYCPIGRMYNVTWFPYLDTKTLHYCIYVCSSGIERGDAGCMLFHMYNCTHCTKHIYIYIRIIHKIKFSFWERKKIPLLIHHSRERKNAQKIHKNRTESEFIGYFVFMCTYRSISYIRNWSGQIYNHKMPSNLFEICV